MRYLLNNATATLLVLIGFCFELSFPADSYVQIDGRELRLNEPISTSLKAQIWPLRRAVRKVYVKKGAGGRVFDDSSLFPNISEVSLTAGDSANNQLLHALSKHNANLKAIWIAQAEPLGFDSLSALKSFKRLELLGLTCELADSAMLQSSVPDSLESLFINNDKASSWRFPPLPKLQLLRFQCNMNRDFLVNFEAPKLQELNVAGAISHEAVSEVARFTHLKVLFIKDPVTKEDNDFLHTLKLRELVCRPETGTP
ncbi:MAG TPA: hypothetical protein V6C81_18505 [Planktothrix sp.]|jgi:hypothetical protein